MSRFADVGCVIGYTLHFLYNHHKHVYYIVDGVAAGDCNGEFVIAVAASKELSFFSSCFAQIEMK